MNTTTWVWGAIVIIIAGGAWWFFSNSNTVSAPAANSGTQGGVPATNNSGQNQPATVNTTGISTKAKTVTVTYGTNGFNPASVTVNKGDTVTFVAAAGADEMWVASDPHPSHTLYDGTSRSTHCAAGYAGSKPLDQCSAGTSFSFTFNQTGTWGYHNHGNAGDRGTVIVK